MYYNDTCNNIVNILIDQQYSQNIIDNIIHNNSNNILLQNNVTNTIIFNTIDNFNYNYLRTSLQISTNNLIHINFINDLQYLAIFLNYLYFQMKYQIIIIIIFLLKKITKILIQILGYY